MVFVNSGAKSKHFLVRVYLETTRRNRSTAREEGHLLQCGRQRTNYVKHFSKRNWKQRTLLRSRFFFTLFILFALQTPPHVACLKRHVGASAILDVAVVSAIQLANSIKSCYVRGPDTAYEMTARKWNKAILNDLEARLLK